MHHKRYLRFLLVVLALALWASTAYGQTLSVSGTQPPFNLSYTQNGVAGQTAAQVTFTLIDSNGNTSGDVVSLQSPVSGLVFACVDYTFDSGPISCTITADPTVWQAPYTPGGPHGFSVPLLNSANSGGTPDLGVTVNVNVLPLLSASPAGPSNAVSLTYQVGKESYTPASSTISASDGASGGSPQSYTWDSSACPPWFVVHSFDSQSKTPDTLEIGLNISSADSAGVTPPGSCTIPLYDSTLYNFATVTVDYQIIAAAPPVFGTSGSIALAPSYTQYAGGSQGSATKTVTVTNTDSSNTDAYSKTNNCPSWLTLTSANDFSTVSGSDTLTFKVNNAADALAPGGQTVCHVLLSYSSVQFADVSVTLTVVQGFPTLNITGAANPVIAYTKYQAAAAKATVTVTTNDDVTGYSDAYTATNGCASWLTLSTASLPAGGGNGTVTTSGGDLLTMTVKASAADALASAPAACTITLSSTASSVQFASLTPTMTLTAGFPTLSITGTANPVIAYTKYQAGAAKATVTVNTNDDISGYSDAYTANNGCAAWLTLSTASLPAGGGNGTVTPSGGDLLTMTVKPSVADGLSVAPAACTITLTSTASGQQLAQTLTPTMSLNASGTPTVSAPSTAIALGNYAIGSNAVVASSIAVTSNDDAGTDAYVAATTCAWLTLKSTSTGSATGGNVSSSASDSLGLTVNTAAANALSPGLQGACHVTITYNAATVATANVSLTITPPVYTASTPIAISLTYTKNGGASQAGAASNVTVSSYDTTADTYLPTIPGSCPAWLNVTSKYTNQASSAQADILTFAIDSTKGDKTAPASTSCSVTLSYGGTTFATVNLTLAITGTATTWMGASQTPITLVYAKGVGAGQATASAIVQVTSQDTLPDNYTVTTPAGCSPYLTVVTTNQASASVPDPLTFGVSASAATASGTPSVTCSVTLKYNGATLFATIPVTVSIVNAPTLVATQNSLSFLTSYVRGSGSAGAPVAVTSKITDTNSTTTDTYTVATIATTAPASAPWLSCSGASPTVGGASNLTDTLTCSVVTAQADALNAGQYTDTVHLVVANEADVLVTVSLTVTSAASPLNSSLASNAVTLTYMIGGGGSQQTVSKTATINSTDQAWDNYTLSVGTPAYTGTLTVTPTNSKAMAGAGNSDSLIIALAAGYTPVAAGSTVYPVLLSINPQSPALRILVTVNVVAQPVVATPASVSLTYTKSSNTATTTGPVSLTVLPGIASTVGFTVTASSVPVWLTVTPASLTATNAGVNVALIVNTTAATGMATGNYTATVSIVPAGYTSTPLTIPVALTISNTAPGLSIKEAQGVTPPITGIWAPGQAYPNPTWTVISSNEPVPFTASCAVVASDTSYTDPTPCTLSATSGVAYTWGDQLTVTWDPNLFLSTLGNYFTITVTITPQGGASNTALSLAYKYTLQPVAPTSGAISPTSAAHIPKNTNLVVLLTGTGFVGTGSIKPGTLEQTQVWLGLTYGSANALAASSYVVLNSTQLMVTIPETAFPVLSNGKASTLSIGVANQTGAAPTQPTAFWTLNVTTAPVIYGITSTATYVQPNPGLSPSFAPYELISLFGDNFGPTGSNSVTATLNANNQVPTSITTGTSGGKAVGLTVTFSSKGSGTKSNSYSAPILFANENQINAIVPSGLPIGYPATVTVTDGTAASDGVFSTNITTAHPGIFTLASDGTGQGAILNHDYSVNQSGSGESVGNYVSIYMTGLGAPDSTAIDIAGNTATFPTGCVAISDTTKNTPGYMQVVNTAATGYTIPSPLWTTIDGAVIEYATTTPPKTYIVSGLVPCMTDAVTVVFGPPGNQVTAIETGSTTSGVTWAGFVAGAVAGLYQVNVYIPAGVPSGTIPVYVTITNSTNNTTYTSPAVQMVVK